MLNIKCSLGLPKAILACAMVATLCVAVGCSARASGRRVAPAENAHDDIPARQYVCEQMEPVEPCDAKRIDPVVERVCQYVPEMPPMPSGELRAFTPLTGTCGPVLMYEAGEFVKTGPPEESMMKSEPMQVIRVELRDVIAWVTVYTGLESWEARGVPQLGSAMVSLWMSKIKADSQHPAIIDKQAAVEAANAVDNVELVRARAMRGEQRQELAQHFPGALRHLVRMLDEAQEDRKAIGRLFDLTCGGNVVLFHVPGEHEPALVGVEVFNEGRLMYDVMLLPSAQGPARVPTRYIVWTAACGLVNGPVTSGD